MLPKARYEYNEASYALVGGGKIYKMGDRIKIRVISTDIVERHINFELADYHREPDEHEEKIERSYNYKRNRKRRNY